MIVPSAPANPDNPGRSTTIVVRRETAEIGISCYVTMKGDLCQPRARATFRGESESYRLGEPFVGNLRLV